MEQDIDPMLDPVMEKQFIIKGKKMSVNVSDKVMDFDPKFMMYFITRLPNPSFSPELQAKVRLSGILAALGIVENDIIEMFYRAVLIRPCHGWVRRSWYHHRRFLFSV